MSTNWTLGDLRPGSLYEAVVCRTNHTHIDVASPYNLPDCGFCITCFQTDVLRIMFEETSVSQLNDTHVILTCGVNSNVLIVFEWSILNKTSSSSPQRVSLSSGFLLYGQRMFIDSSRRYKSGRDFTGTSTLIAPNLILGKDVRCTAFTPFGSKFSLPGAFTFQGSYIAGLVYFASL